MSINNSRLRCKLFLLTALCVSLVAAVAARGQNTGSPHDPEIFGVRIGMDVPTALRAVWENANESKPGKEKPDAKRDEGKDVRVLYKLKSGNLEILFADGKWVKEVQLEYDKPLRRVDLNLVPNGSILNAMGGQRYDDRYSSGFTSDRKREQYWWRDEKTPEGYRVRIGFISTRIRNYVEENITVNDIARKIVSVMPEDVDKFKKAMSAQSKQ